MTTKVNRRETMSMTYPGGKGGPGVYQTLISQMPPHQTYIETHLGGGAILRHKQPAALNIGIDLDGEALTTVASQIRLQHRHARRGLPANIVTRVAIPAINGGGAAPPPLVVEPDNLATYGGVQYEFIQTDCVPWLLSRRWRGNEIVYADPPYLMHTRREGRKLYTHEYADADHVALLSALRSLPCMVMVSGYWSELYADTLADWRTVTFTTADRGGNLRTEWAWMNYPAPTTLHDYAFLGKDYRERERIKRKRSRWVRMLAAMPPLERMAIIEELIA